ncbi:DAK2 domain-containing protein [Tenggerimyces flavus]|uniref:DAK2 domain-containing protein n=1 Tax=Tenggerimyces flavus TaxID=1708749 RepID=A0ABV7YCR2_9ACTN|nr:DAK2 domain-containing protein [Tenggerimyces flavus]MBM7786662.1 DAK2 domain fusion protein YloV [Tenggerimyces flavus]
MGDKPAVGLLRRWCRAGLADLTAARREIDVLNVYPIPDADTGTNLQLTMAAACGGAEDGEQESVSALLRTVSRHALLGARGNSGVILAQLLRGAALALDGKAELDGPDLALALRAAADAGYVAVEVPAEGTMLTVIRAAAEAANDRAAQPDPTLHAVALVGAAAAREALAHTPEQLEVLRRAGVVDAGGRGLVVLLDALVSVLSGGRSEDALPAPSEPTPMPEVRLDPDDPAYEVLYLLDAPDDAIAPLRSALARLGNSLVVVGGDGLWNVHVHVDDPGAAVEAGIEAGRPHRIRITPLKEIQYSASASAEGCVDVPAVRGVVAVAAGPGLGELFGSAGVTVVEAKPGRPSSATEVLAAIRTAGTAEIVVLPNDPDGIAIAEQAAARARDEGLRVAVVPARAQVQGLAACAVHDASRSFDEDVVAMTAAAGHTRHGAVTVATRDAITSAGWCKAGDVLGVVEGDFALIGADLATVGRDVLARLLGGGGELVTVVTGADADAGLAAAVLEGVRATRPEVDTMVYDGGQPRYPLLIGVE